MDLEPDRSENVETYTLDREQIEALVHQGFCESVFLDGRPGSAQTVDIRFEWDDFCPNAYVTVKTVNRG